MRYLLNAGKDEEIDFELLRAVREELGFDGVRTDLAGVTDKKLFANIVLDIRDAGLWPLVIVGDPEQILWTPADATFHPGVELGNEHDPGGVGEQLSPLAYRMRLRAAKRLAEQRPHLTLYGGAISNLDRNSLAWLREVERDLPAHVTIHRYPRSIHFHEAQEGFLDRKHEVIELKDILKGRFFGVSEFGYHTAPVKRVGWLPSWIPHNQKRLTDQQAAQEIRKEFNFWKNEGVEFAALYQVNDGPTEGKLDRYGIRTTYGAWKEQAFTVPAPYLRDVA